MDSHMAGLAFPHDYLHHLRRTVLNTTPACERALLKFSGLTWLHTVSKHHLLIKNPARSARVPLLLRLFPRCRFILLKRRPSAVRSWFWSSSDWPLWWVRLPDQSLRWRRR